ncbi:AraC family transcriptional regulator [Actinomadura sp. CNU-125]|uniref:AraC family transcriptional regulator n=1 Tax=Actinomadura sp. CNU-125 TaxID=1904961 RepID=UPI002916B043|nr:AraC family transcriptional regulator [Actinomadura sp. CNU-125]
MNGHSGAWWQYGEHSCPGSSIAALAFQHSHSRPRRGQRAGRPDVLPPQDERHRQSRPVQDVDRRHATRAGLVGDCRFDADIRMDFAELHKFYHFNIPLSGSLCSRNRGNEITATPERAVLYGPTGDVRLTHWSAGSRILCVKIRREALEAELERLLQRPIRSPIELAPSMDLVHGYGRVLRDLARLLAGQAGREESLTRQEIIGAPLWHSMLSHLLAAADHDYRDELLTPGPPCRPRTVERVIDAMRASPETPFSVAELAETAGVGIRTLQTAFKAHVGMPPMAYLRNLRLERAHADLLSSDPSSTTVSDVAHRWGFAHLGRFAAAYGDKYGVLPSDTLRTAR